jgi:hypothetical protein
MATAYIGVRPILKGRNAKDNINTGTGAVEVYSNWSLMNSSHVLDGFPDRNVALGTQTRLSAPTMLEYMFSGKAWTYPMAGAGGGTRLSYHRTKPLEYKGLAGSAIFQSGYGHIDRVTSYSLDPPFEFSGLASAEALKAPGHAVRYTAAYGGASNPLVWKGVASAKAMPGTVGKTLPVSYDYDYGFNRVNEWRGVPSAKAL